MATILRGYGWECGQLMVPSSDKYRSSDDNGISTVHKTGTYGLDFVDYNGGYLRFPVSGSPSDPSVSIWIHPDGMYIRDNSFQLRWLLTTGQYIELRWKLTTHTFDAYVNNALVASGTVEVTSSDWFHVQFYVVIADAGSIGVKINGHQSIDYSGDTQPGIAAGASYFYLANSHNQSTHRYVDDMVLGYGGYLGDLRCPDIRPNADTAVDDWTPSAGDNYATVDESSTTAATIDADYNKAGIDGDEDELALGDFDGATYVPVAVTAWCRAQQLAANGDSIKIGIDSAGTEAETTWPLSNTMEYYFHTSDDNPADAAEWEDADIDALLVRYEAVIV